MLYTVDGTFDRTLLSEVTRLRDILLLIGLPSTRTINHKFQLW